MKPRWWSSCSTAAEGQATQFGRDWRARASAEASLSIDQNQVSQTIRQVVQAYDARRAGLLKALGDASKARLGIEFAVSKFGPHASRPPEVVQCAVFHRLAALVRAGITPKTGAQDLATALLPGGSPQAPDLLRDGARGPLTRICEALSQAAVASETLLALGFFGAQDEGIPWPLTTFALAISELGEQPAPLPFGNHGVDGREEVVPLPSFD